MSFCYRQKLFSPHYITFGSINDCSWTWPTMKYKPSQTKDPTPRCPNRNNSILEHGYMTLYFTLWERHSHFFMQITIKMNVWLLIHTLIEIWRGATPHLHCIRTRVVTESTKAYLQCKCVFSSDETNLMLKTLLIKSYKSSIFYYYHNNISAITSYTLHINIAEN